MALHDIASYSKKIYNSDSGDCSDFRIKIPAGFSINMEENSIMIDTFEKGTVKSLRNAGHIVERAYLSFYIFRQATPK